MNYGQLKALVNQYLEVNETTFNANIGQFVRNAEDDIYRQVQFPDLSKTVSLSLSTAFLNLPDDFLSPYYLSVISGGEYVMMLSKDQSFIRETYPTTGGVGVPRFYAIYNGDSMLIGPAPDQSYTMELSYFYKPVSLSLDPAGDNATSWLSINGEAALLYGTLIQGYIYLKGDQDVMKQYSDQYDRAVSELKVIAEGRDEKDTYRSPDRRLPV